MIKAIGTLLSFTPEEFQFVQKSIEYKVCRELWGAEINNHVTCVVVMVSIQARSTQHRRSEINHLFYFVFINCLIISKIYFLQNHHLLEYKFKFSLLTEASTT